jgi:hypothetical protein
MQEALSRERVFWRSGACPWSDAERKNIEITVPQIVPHNAEHNDFMFPPSQANGLNGLGDYLAERGVKEILHNLSAKKRQDENNEHTPRIVADCPSAYSLQHYASSLLGYLLLKVILPLKCNTHILCI